MHSGIEIADRSSPRADKTGEQSRAKERKRRFLGVRQRSFFLALFMSNRLLVTRPWITVLLPSPVQRVFPGNLETALYRGLGAMFVKIPRFTGVGVRARENQ